MQNGKKKHITKLIKMSDVLSLWPLGKSLASQLIATLLWILKVWLYSIHQDVEDALYSVC